MTFNYIRGSNEFRIICNSIFRKMHAYKIIVSNGDVLYCGFRYDRNLNFDFISNTIDSKLKCRTCKNFIDEYARIAFLENTFVFDNAPSPYNLLSNSLNKDNGSIVIFNKEELGIQYSGGFRHFVVTVNPSIMKTFSHSDYQHYLNQDFDFFLRTLNQYSSNMMIDSLNLFIEILPKVSYGDKLEHAAKWFRDCVQTWNLRTSNDVDNKMLALQLLLSYKLDKGDHIIHTGLRQVKNNVLDCLEHAHDESTLISMLNKRLSPLNYCRTSGMISDQQLEEGLSVFNECGFYTKIMEFDDVVKYGGHLVKHIPREDFRVPVLNSELNHYQSRRNRAHNFAYRSRKNYVKITMSDLIRNLDRYPNLEVSVDGLDHILLSVYPETARHLIKHDYLWAFKYGCDLHNVNNGYYMRIDAIMITPNNSIMFINKNLKKEIPINTCFPEFLKNEYQRKYRRVFESFNKQDIRPSIKNGALGFGSSFVKTPTFTFRSNNLRIEVSQF